MTNPFHLRWLQGWTFQTVLMEGHVQIEAHGYGIRLRTPLLAGESPRAGADRLVLQEDRRRRSLHHAWRRGQLQRPTPASVAAVPPLSDPAVDPLTLPVPPKEVLFASGGLFSEGSPYLVGLLEEAPQPLLAV